MPAMSASIAHTVAYFIRLVRVLKVLYLINWLRPGLGMFTLWFRSRKLEFGSFIVNRVGGIMQLNRPIEYENDYLTIRCIPEIFETQLR